MVLIVVLGLEVSLDILGLESGNQMPKESDHCGRMIIRFINCMAAIYGVDSLIIH
jgi:hypothetical protein